MMGTLPWGLNTVDINQALVNLVLLVCLTKLMERMLQCHGWFKEGELGNVFIVLKKKQTKKTISPIK